MLEDFTTKQTGRSTGQAQAAWKRPRGPNQQAETYRDDHGDLPKGEEEPTIGRSSSNSA